jgi:hypothetical protein
MFWYILLGLGIGLSIWLVGYALQRCAGAKKKIDEITGVTTEDTVAGKISDESEAVTSGPEEKEAEDIARYDEVSWIGTSGHILTFMAYFSFFIGHIWSSAWYAFMGYYMLDGCSPVGDPRKYGLAFVLFPMFPIGLLVKGTGGLFSGGNKKAAQHQGPPPVYTPPAQR